MIRIFSVLSLTLTLVLSEDIKCFDTGDVGGNHLYEFQEKGIRVVYKCERSIANCQELAQSHCKRLSEEILQYMGFVEIKDGYLITQTCFDEGLFHDCPLMEYQDNKRPLLLLDGKGEAHKLDLESIKASQIDKLILKHSITVQGYYSDDSEVIKVSKIFQEIPVFTQKHRYEK